MTTHDAVPMARQVSRRRVLGYLVAAPTLAVGVRLGADASAPSSAGEPAGLTIPTPGLPADIFDLADAQNYAAKPTAHLIRMDVREDGTVHFALPRMEVGQGIVTSTAMIIADELDVPLENVVVTLAKARPELLMNQLTGGSNTTVSTYYPIRTAAAIARGALLEAAALMLGGLTPAALDTDKGEVIAPDGTRIPYGDLARKAAVKQTRQVEVDLKATSELLVVGTPVGRTDARDIVTGAKQFVMDLDVPDALPCMVCRPPTINGTVRSIRNEVDVVEMPGVTHVAVIPTGVAVRARTFGQCIDAIRALDVDWTPGAVGTDSDDDILAELKRAETAAGSSEGAAPRQDHRTSFTFMFASNSGLETNCAIADVRADSAEIWGGVKVPIAAQQEIAHELGLPLNKVTVNVVQGGGSFGRKLFHDGPMDAALASQAMGAPVKLMWHRADDCRQGRVHPMCTSRVRATVLGDQVTSDVPTSANTAPAPCSTRLPRSASGAGECRVIMRRGSASTTSTTDTRRASWRSMPARRR